MNLRLTIVSLYIISPGNLNSTNVTLQERNSIPPMKGCDTLGRCPCLEDPNARCPPPEGIESNMTTSNDLNVTQDNLSIPQMTNPCLGDPKANCPAPNEPEP